MVSRHAVRPSNRSYGLFACAPSTSSDPVNRLPSTPYAYSAPTPPHPNNTCVLFSRYTHNSCSFPSKKFSLPSVVQRHMLLLFSTQIIQLANRGVCLCPPLSVQPHLSYREIVTTMVDANLHRTPREFVPEARRTLATVLTFLLPKGCLIRTAQVGLSLVCLTAVPSRACSLHGQYSMDNGHKSW